MHSVYLVDDDPLIVESLRSSILWMDNGFEIVGSSTEPVHALDAILEIEPDVVFTDLKMPSMNGNELAKELRNRGISCEIVLLSAFGTFEDARSFFRLDGFDYLLKPLQQNDAQIVLERLSRKLAEKNSEPVQMTFFPSGNKNFDELADYLTENFAKRHTLSTLSELFHISPNYICNLFAKHYNSTLTIFLTNLRMKEAARLITSTPRPFKEIAIDCGYRDYFYFCKAFKEFYGMTPSLYREEQ